ncbi:hypothetical protein, partial [Mycobacterium tuberculosis]|uniref:hypothetical protein n=1 Tax=Mycobacterium tuberculosis TaxID=1773 RepID=UPI001BE07BC1
WFYIDVSFWAPLFKIYPLEKNWEVEHNGLKVGWEVDSASGSANLMRNGQIAKQWDGSFSNKDQFLNLWNKSIMNKNYFNSTLLINRWLDRENFIFLKDRTYRISSGARLI